MCVKPKACRDEEDDPSEEFSGIKNIRGQEMKFHGGNSGEEVTCGYVALIALMLTRCVSGLP